MFVKSCKLKVTKMTFASRMDKYKLWYVQKTKYYSVLKAIKAQKMEGRLECTPLRERR